MQQWAVGSLVVGVQANGPAGGWTLQEHARQQPCCHNRRTCEHAVLLRHRLLMSGWLLCCGSCESPVQQSCQCLACPLALACCAVGWRVMPHAAPAATCCRRSSTCGRQRTCDVMLLCSWRPNLASCSGEGRPSSVARALSIPLQCVSACSNARASKQRAAGRWEVAQAARTSTSSCGTAHHFKHLPQHRWAVVKTRKHAADLQLQRLQRRGGSSGRRCRRRRCSYGPGLRPSIAAGTYRRRCGSLRHAGIAE